MSGLSKDFDIPSVASISDSHEGQENRTLKVTLLSREWRSSTDGDLSTINRELAVQLAKHSNEEVSVFLPQCSEEDRNNAESHDVRLVVAETLPAQAIAELNDKSYQLKFVGAPRGKGAEIADKFPQHGIDRNQLLIHSLSDSREVFADILCLPVLVSGNSGFGEALREVPFGSVCVIDSEDPKDWAKEIKAVRQKKRSKRLAETKLLCEKYLEMYSWEEPIRSLVERMYSLIFGVESRPVSAKGDERPASSVLGDDHSKQFRGKPINYDQREGSEGRPVIAAKDKRSPCTVFGDHLSKQLRGALLHFDHLEDEVQDITKSVGLDVTMQCPENPKSTVDMLLRLTCRDMKTAKIEDAIDNQLLPITVDKKDKKKFFHFIRHNQTRILLVLDGLDELPKNLLEEFMPLISGRVFPLTYVMLTARHEAGMKVRRHCDALFEIVGYTKEDADDYIIKYFRSHEKPILVEKLIMEIDRDSQLRELTADALNTALLCLVFEDTGGILPHNKTTLYCELVNCVLKRYCSKKEISLDYKDPVEKYTDQLNQLGELALEALLENELTFTLEELKSQSTEFLELGFLSREASASKIKPKTTYAVIHKTCQEYFAAFHLAHELLTTDKDEATLLGQLCPVDKYWQVWEFLMTTAASKSDYTAVFVVSSICAAFQHQKPDQFSNCLYAQQVEDSDDEWSKGYRISFLLERALLQNRWCDENCHKGDSEETATMPFDFNASTQEEDSDDEWYKGYRNRLLLEMTPLQSRWGDENYHKDDIEETATMPFYLSASAQEEDSDDKRSKGYRNSLLLERASLQRRRGEENFHKDDTEETGTMLFDLKAYALEEDSDDGPYGGGLCSLSPEYDDVICKDAGYE
ncbi:NLR family CARD domain-containing protein 4 [Stylophora pistillata]|uniref:NLR family CARD domain-containing protein 4 n=1 Tax=Stylophora pistillata TaxID=50429 RepID=A0A2B4R3Z2_STYPI|nr:NLR family CARD domain-containing protein 4 [Stylophora pistillata]